MNAVKQYKDWLKEVKGLVASSKAKAALSVNEHLIVMYWQLGQMIIAKQNEHQWGDTVIERLSADLQKAFPEMKGFSRANLYNCKKWVLFYSDKKVQQAVGQIQKTLPVKIVQQPVGQLKPATKKILSLVTQIPWSHNIIAIEKTNSIDEALFYITQTIENNWSRSMLMNQIALQLHKRKGRAINNFSSTLPSVQSNLAGQVLKDPYVFDFLSVRNIIDEKSLENELVNHVTKFLVELGKGFAFVGRQYHIEVSKKDYWVDILFYHLHLRCYVVVELKTDEFKPEHAGKMSFYLSAIDSLIANKKHDNPTIGIILCKEKDNVTAEFAIRNILKPIGISRYDFIKSLPKEIKTSMPTIKELENELKKV
jgi:predicted nuclease of restriction endonuclease-like (RecB) superfamily